MTPQVKGKPVKFRLTCLENGHTPEGRKHRRGFKGGRLRDWVLGEAGRVTGDCRQLRRGSGSAGAAIRILGKTI